MIIIREERVEDHDSVSVSACFSALQNSKTEKCQNAFTAIVLGYPIEYFFCLLTCETGSLKLLAIRKPGESENQLSRFSLRGWQRANPSALSLTGYRRCC